MYVLGRGSSLLLGPARKGVEEKPYSRIRTHDKASLNYRSSDLFDQKLADLLHFAASSAIFIMTPQVNPRWKSEP